MDEADDARPMAFETSGRAWIGTRQASGSFVKLRARADDLSVTTPIGSISFSPREVVAFRPLRGLFRDGGFEIVHTVDRRNVQFWCRDADVVLQRIAATGFAPRGIAGGGPDPARRARHEEESRAGTRGMLKFVVILVAGFVLLFGAIALMAMFAMQHAEIYETTWAAVQVDPRVLAVTGSPVTSTTPSGSVNTVGTGGTAAIRYDVSGPNGRGSVEADGTKTADRWVVDRFVFRPDGDAMREIDLGRR